MACEPDVDNTN